MSDFDIETIRAQVRAMNFVRGTPAEIAMWHEDMADSRANLVIEDMIPTPNDDAFFAMMLDEGVPLPLYRKSCSGCSIIPTPTGPCRSRRWKRTDAEATDQPAVRGLRRLRGADGEQRLAQGHLRLW
ncbi:hypothetical protein [Sphingomonas aerolata]|uniref:hypothetical protein n=1 Tax=Sphingomonas aerolata TaxID=185951 RepID=UPI002FE0D6BD